MKRHEGRMVTHARRFGDEGRELRHEHGRELTWLIRLYLDDSSPTPILKLAKVYSVLVYRFDSTR